MRSSAIHAPAMKTYARVQFSLPFAQLLNRHNDVNVGPL